MLEQTTCQKHGWVEGFLFLDRLLLIMVVKPWQHETVGNIAPLQLVSRKGNTSTQLTLFLYSPGSPECWD